MAQEMLGSVRLEQRTPMLILAILHWLALEGHPVLGLLYVVVRDDAPLIRRALGRSTQTNEPGRCALLQAMIADGHRMINPLEIGCSARINLHLDLCTVSEADSRDLFTLTCRDVTGPCARTPPMIARRVGIDPRPLCLRRELFRR